MEKVKLCIECKHHANNPYEHSCWKNYKMLVDLVTGEERPEGIYRCYDSRLASSGPCGKEGRYWEPKG